MRFENTLFHGKWDEIQTVKVGIQQQKTLNKAYNLKKVLIEIVSKLQFI